ncbi:hypothetical protein NE857_03475 [Nocardiopsis exhalans]|uniref:Uncharacterized protein n=1 Tax=Nocardiopsis exhalans TaxID=163604 RepID=A0ABY5D8R0_9ACTN|nr:hypothetical protein [Nocardiopsis exhalans]USY20731.1 hypothetical protein NE857_03475 [Nocardiopsis exhalans]
MGNTPNTTSHDEGRPPLAIWPCAPEHTHHTPARTHLGEVSIPDRLAARLVDEYTRPEGRVADLTGVGEIAHQAWERGRSHQVLHPGMVSPGAAAASDLEVAWAELTVTTVTPTPSCAVSPWAARRRVRARVEFAALITRPGGIVAVVTPVGHAPAGVVRAAACAGLVYLQHVIALTVPICDAGLGAAIPVRGKGGFDPDHDPHISPREGEDEVGLSTSVAEAAATITSPAHLNVSVFRKKGRTTPARAHGEVEA